MRNWSRSQLLACMVLTACLGSLLPLPSRSQETAAPAPALLPPEAIEARFQEARELIKNAQYGRAVDLLEPAIESLRPNMEKLREAYLLLIYTYEVWGNDERRGPNGMRGAELIYGKARDLIRECLGIRELRHMRPEPETDFPVEMVRDFEQVRNELFGQFRVASLEPKAAVVILDSDTLSGTFPSTWTAWVRPKRSSAVSTLSGLRSRSDPTT